MRIHLPTLNIRTFIIGFLFCSASFAQNREPKLKSEIFTPIIHSEKTLAPVCAPSVILNGCNYISNNNFTPLPFYFSPDYIYYAIPFNYDWAGNSLVPSWDVANGTPTIYDGIAHAIPAPPSGYSGYFFGATGNEPSVGGYMSESVVQKIPPLITNKTYALSFQKMFMDFTTDGGTTNFPLDHFNIVLMRCQDYNQMFVPYSYQVPPLPAISQTIYCETNVQNPNWNQVFIKFTADYPYDMIWIYPQGDVGHDYPGGIFFAGPELIDISNFNAGPSPNPISPNCTVFIGPTAPNCAPTGAVFTWTSPNGSILPALSNQQIQIDASVPSNIGIWTLKMTMPNAVITNSTCSQQPASIQATVNVCACQTTPAPTIETIQIPIRYTYNLDKQSTAYFQRLCSPFWLEGYPAIQNWCYQNSLMSGYMNFGNNLPSYQSFIADFFMTPHAINSTGTISALAFPQGADYQPCLESDIIDVKLKFFHKLKQCERYDNVLEPFYLTTPHSGNNAFTVKRTTTWMGKENCTNGYNVEFYTYDNPPPSASDIINVPASSTPYDDYTINVTQQVKNSLNSNSTYIGFLVQQVQNITYNNVAFFGLINFDYTVDLNEPYIELTYVRRYYPNNNPCNQAKNIPVNYEKEPLLNPVTPFADNSIKKFPPPINNVTTYPNPANNFIIVSSKQALINFIEIYDMSGSLLKKIQANNTKTILINTSAFAGGQYTCKITTSKGIEYQKLLVNRK